MRSHLNLLLLLSLIATITSCAQPVEEPVEEAATTKADVEAIERLVKQYEDAVNAADVEAWLKVLTDNAIWMRPGNTSLNGKDALRPWGQEAFDYANLVYAFSTEQIEVAGDWAFLRGSGTVEVTPKDSGQTRHSSYKYIWIMRQQADGSWKFSHSIWNSNTSPSGQ